MAKRPLVALFLLRWVLRKDRNLAVSGERVLALYVLRRAKRDLQIDRHRDDAVEFFKSDCSRMWLEVAGAGHLGSRHINQFLEELL